MSILDTKVDGSIPSINMFSHWARDFIRIASVDSAVKWVPGGDNLVKGVQCYELFGGIALKIHIFSFHITYLTVHNIIRILFCLILLLLFCSHILQLISYHAANSKFFITKTLDVQCNDISEEGVLETIPLRLRFQQFYQSLTELHRYRRVGVAKLIADFLDMTLLPKMCRTLWFFHAVTQDLCMTLWFFHAMTQDLCMTLWFFHAVTQDLCMTLWFFHAVTQDLCMTLWFFHAVTQDHQVLPYCVQVYWEEAWFMSWSECCGSAMAFLLHVSHIWCCSSAVAVVAQTSYFVCASYFDRKPMKWS